MKTCRRPSIVRGIGLRELVRNVSTHKNCRKRGMQSPCGPLHPSQSNACPLSWGAVKELKVKYHQQECYNLL